MTLCYNNNQIYKFYVLVWRLNIDSFDCGLKVTFAVDYSANWQVCLKKEKIRLFNLPSVTSLQTENDYISTWLANVPKSPRNLISRALDYTYETPF